VHNNSSEAVPKVFLGIEYDVQESGGAIDVSGPLRKDEL
jgi:hypothetical protein